MQTKLIGVLSLICLIFTITWLVFFISSMAVSGPLESFDQVLEYVKKADVIFYITYINAAFITLSVVMLFSVFYLHFRQIAPEWSVVGIVFVPIYGAMNLIVYLSQISILPRLIHLQSALEDESISQFLLMQIIQQWPDSAISVINNLAYAVLGIPSIIFGILMIQSTSAVRVGGILLTFNGMACIAGFIGIVMQSTWLNQGSLIGGILFLLALIPMTLGFLKMRPDQYE